MDGSFGDENNNIIINSNENNLSFENQNLVESEQIYPKIESIEEPNEIFDNIPTELETEEQDKKTFYQDIFLQETLKYSLDAMFNIIRRKIIEKKQNFFIKIKSISNKKFNKIAEAEIIFLHIESSLKGLLNIYKKTHFQSKQKFFYLWSFKAGLIKNIQLIEKKTENKYKNEENEKIKQLNTKLEKVEKESKNYESNFNNLQNYDNELKNKLNKLRDNNKKKSDIIKNLEAKIKTLNDTIKYKNSNMSNNFGEKNYETIIHNLTSKIEKIKRENEQKQIQFEEFYQQMNEMLGVYERNYEQEVQSLSETDPTIAISQQNLSPKDRNNSKIISKKFN